MQTNAVARYIARISLGIIKSGKKYKPYSWRENKKEKEDCINRERQKLIIK